MPGAVGGPVGGGGGPLPAAVGGAVGGGGPLPGPAPTVFGAPATTPAFVNNNGHADLQQGLITVGLAPALAEQLAAVVSTNPTASPKKEINPYDTARSPGGIAPTGGGWAQVWAPQLGTWTWVDFTGHDNMYGAQPVWFTDEVHGAVQTRGDGSEITQVEMQTYIVEAALPNGWVKEAGARTIAQCFYAGDGTAAAKLLETAKGDAIRIAMVASTIAGYLTERQLAERIASSDSSSIC